MSQSAKRSAPQETSRRGWAGALGRDAMAQADAAFKRAGFADPILVLRWSEIAGPAVAAVAEPLRCQEGPNGAVLTLRCEPGAAVFLQHETRALVERLNAYLGAGRIARLRLSSGALSGPAPPLPHPRPARAPAPPADDGLRGALERLGTLRRNLRKNR